jgi:hypothetical protein
VKHQPPILLEAESDAFSDSTQSCDVPPNQRLDRRPRRAENEKILDPHLLQSPPKHAFSQRLDVDLNVRQLRHGE